MLLAINLFNYIDRQILSATLPKIKLDATMFSPTDPNLQFKLGLLTTAFMVSYMLLSPVFGILGDRKSRWWLIGGGVIGWSLASGGSGLATGFVVLLLTRCLVGIGEAAYGPVAPSMISDLYPIKDRGKALARFYLAIPVGSALGFVIGGAIAETSWGWRGAFLVVVLPGILLGSLCFRMHEPPRRAQANAETSSRPSYVEVLQSLLRNRSYLLNSAGMTASTFILGGVAVWVPEYLFQREARFRIDSDNLAKIEQLQATDGTPVIPRDMVQKLRAYQGETVYSASELQMTLTQILSADQLKQYNATLFEYLTAADSIRLGEINFRFGVIVVVSGLGATLLGGWLGDRYRSRYSGSYFLVSALAMLIAFPAFLAMLYSPSPWNWWLMFLAVFCLFINTGPTNTILANVTASRIRSTAFAINILVIHALGDAISPAIIGLIADYSNLQSAFLICSFFILFAGLTWLIGVRYLEADTVREQ